MDYEGYLRKYNPSGNIKSFPESSYEDYQDKYGSKELEEEPFVALSYKDYVNKYAAKDKAKEKWVKEQLAKPITTIEPKIKPSIPQEAGITPIEISSEERARLENRMGEFRGRGVKVYIVIITPHSVDSSTVIAA